MANKEERGKSFSFIILLMLILPMIFTFLPDTFDLKLDGVVINEKPQFSVGGVLDGSYQETVEAYINSNLGLRGGIIRIGNQLAYTVLNKSTHSGECIGKNGQLYELEYVYKKMQYIGPVTQEYMDELIQKLQMLQQELGEAGIQLFIFITPSKAEVYPEDIGWIYKKCAPEQRVSSYQLLLQGLDNGKIPYFDSVSYVNGLKNEQNRKIYSLTGTHWTQTIGATVSAQLIKELENNFGYDLTEYTITEERVAEPTAPDADIFNLLNIMQEPYDDYTIPQIEIVKNGKDKPSIFCRGGSFMGQSITWLIYNDVVNDGIHMENTYVFTDKYTNVQSFTDYDQVDVKQMIENKDILLLEVNQGAIDKMSFGFIDYLLENRNVVEADE